MLMRNPVQTVDGHTYERPEIEKWLQSSNKSTKTLLPLTSKELTTNFAMRSCCLIPMGNGTTAGLQT